MFNLKKALLLVLIQGPVFCGPLIKFMIDGQEYMLPRRPGATLLTILAPVLSYDRYPALYMNGIEISATQIPGSEFYGQEVKVEMFHFVKTKWGGLGYKGFPCLFQVPENLNPFIKRADHNEVALHIIARNALIEFGIAGDFAVVSARESQTKKFHPSVPVGIYTYTKELPENCVNGDFVEIVFGPSKLCEETLRLRVYNPVKPLVCFQFVPKADFDQISNLSTEKKADEPEGETHHEEAKGSAD